MKIKRLEEEPELCVYDLEPGDTFTYKLSANPGLHVALRAVMMVIQTKGMPRLRERYILNLETSTFYKLEMPEREVIRVHLESREVKEKNNED